MCDRLVKSIIALTFGVYMYFFLFFKRFIRYFTRPSTVGKVSFSLTPTMALSVQLRVNVNEYQRKINKVAVTVEKLIWLISFLQQVKGSKESEKALVLHSF